MTPEDVLRAKKAFLKNKQVQVSALSQSNPYLMEVAQDYQSYLAETAEEVFRRVLQHLPNDKDRQRAIRQWERHST